MIKRKRNIVVMDGSERAIVRVELPPEILATGLYTTDRPTN